MANKEWLELYPKAKVLNGFANSSDHNPIILTLQEKKRLIPTGKLHSFRFEPMWLRDNSFKHETEKLWREARLAGFSLKEKLSICGSKLQQWNKEKFGNFQHKIKGLKDEIDKLRNSFRTDDIVEEEASEELDEWLTREELLWKQRARADWLKDGERNSAFFRAKATRGKERKMIDFLIKEDGAEIYDTKDIMDECVSYFTYVFSSNHSRDSQINWNHVTRAVQPRITDDNNRKLMEPFTEAEVRAALYQMHPNKAPGMDGFSALFFQKNWDMIKTDVCEEILRFLNTGELDGGLNVTQIVLLPKKDNSSRVEDFRPIS